MSIWWLVPFYVWVIVKTYHNSEVCTQIQLAEISSLTSSLDLVTTKNYWFFFCVRDPEELVLSSVERILKLMNTYSLSFHLIMMVKEIGKTAFLSIFFSHIFFFIFLFCSLLLLSLPKLTTYHTFWPNFKWGGSKVVSQRRHFVLSIVWWRGEGVCNAKNVGLLTFLFRKWWMQEMEEAAINKCYKFPQQPVLSNNPKHPLKACLGLLLST